MFKYEYDQIIREYFDLSDKYTRKYILSLTEDAQQDQLLAALSSALYEKIVSKVDDIDFGTIPLSRGDITKVEGFESTEECLDIIRRLVIEYKQNPSIVDIVISSINNIKQRKALFIKGYALNAELPMLLYNTMVLAVERSVSLMIATCIEFVKDPTSTNLKMALDKAAYVRTMDDLLFKQLINFNNMCHNGQFDKTLEAVMKNGPKVAKEEVENMYATVHPIDEEDPTSPEMPYQDDSSPFDSDSTVEPAINRMPADAEPEVDLDFIHRMRQDYSEVPSSQNAPFDPLEYDNNYENYDDEDDIDPDTEIQYTEPADDEVEPENIPTVNPDDDISSSDTPINELEDDDENDETDNGVPFEPVAPVGEVGIATGIGIAAGAVAIAGFGKLFINGIFSVIRMTIYYFYYSRAKFSDYLNIQADLLEANANDLQYSNDSELSDKEKNKVVKKQLKFVQKLRKWANLFAIDSKSASNKASKQASDDDKNKNKIPNNDDDGGLF